MNSSDGNAGPQKPSLSVIEGTGTNRHHVEQAFLQMCWSLDVLYDLKLSAERQGFDDVAKEIEVAYLRVKFLLTRDGN